MILVDEYLAIQVVLGTWPDGLPDDDDIAIPASRHWRLLQRIHKPSNGRLSTLLAGFSDGALRALRFPHPEVLHVLDTRPLLDDAAVINARHNAGGWLMSESLAAAVVHRRELWFGREDDVGARLATTAEKLDIAIHVLD